MVDINFSSVGTIIHLFKQFTEVVYLIFDFNLNSMVLVEEVENTTLRFG